MKISFNDLEIVKGITDHLGHMLNQEYLRLLDDSKVKKLEEEISAKDNDYLSNYSRTANIHRNFTGFYDVEPIENLNSDR